MFTDFENKPMPRSVAIPPGPKGRFLSGNLREFQENPLAFLESIARTYGDVVSLRLGPVKIWALNHPDLIEQVLVDQNRKFTKHFALRRAKPTLGEGLLTSEGDFWRRQRKLAQPAFHKDRIASYASIMVDYTERMLATWNSGETRDIQHEMMKTTLQIVAKCLFDADVEGDAKDVSDAMETITHSFNDRVRSVVRTPIWLPTRSNVRYLKAKKRIDEVVLRIVAERRKSTENHGDLLSMLIQARDDDNGGMTDRQLRDEAVTLFLAGHETTANTLAWAWLLLSRHPKAEAKLHEELDAVLGDRPPTIEDLPRLKYTENVVAETLRYYPTVWLLGREAIEPCELGGYLLPRGHTVWMSQWVVHRDPRFFAEPDRFLPDRWADDLAKKSPRYAYFPFGGGPRICIGDSFAKMEAVLMLATIARKFRLKLVPGATVAMLPSITLRADGGIPMTIHQHEYAGQKSIA